MSMLYSFDFGFNGECVPDPYFFDGFEGFDKDFKMNLEKKMTLI